MVKKTSFLSILATFEDEFESVMTLMLAEKDPSSSRDVSPTDPRRCLVLRVNNIGHSIKEQVAL